MIAVTEDTQTRRLTDEQRELFDKHWEYLPRYVTAFRRTRPWLDLFGLTFDDLLSHAVLGMFDAARTFEPWRGLKFTTHFPTRVTGAMLDAVRASLPKGYRRNAGDDALPTVGSLSAEIVNEKWHGNSLLDFIPAEGEPVGTEIEARENFLELTRALPRKHREAVRGYYGDGVTMRLIGEALDVSEPRVSQLISQAHELLRERLSARNAG